MENDLDPQLREIDGINLDDYFPNYRSYNSVEYYHKRFLQKPQYDVNLKKRKVLKDKGKRKKGANTIQHKGQQFDSDTVNNLPLRFETGHYIPVLENGVKFNKLVPLLIPTIKESESDTLLYTVETKKLKKQNVKSPRPIEKDLTYNKEKIIQSHSTKKRKSKTHVSSARESFDPSSQNTLDDLHLNINQTSSFSETCGLKYPKKQQEKCNKNSSCKYLVSNSFDAMATESMSGDCNKIKIQFMNESHKKIFTDSIKNPILSVIKEYLSTNAYINNVDTGLSELKTMQKFLKYNNQKLDIILQKLACLEAKIDSKAEQTIEVDKSPHLRYTCKASKLEELSEAFSEVKEDKSSDEDFIEDLEIRKKRIKTRNKSVVVMMDDKEMNDGKKDTMACGEDVPGLQDMSPSTSQLGIKPERPNRIPTRFCWTDADRLN